MQNFIEIRLRNPELLSSGGFRPPRLDRGIERPRLDRVNHFASKQCLFVNACWMWTFPQSGILELIFWVLSCHRSRSRPILRLNVFCSNKSVQLCVQNSIKIRGSMIQKSSIILASEYILGFKFTYKTVRRLQVQSLSCARACQKLV